MRHVLAHKVFDRNGLGPQLFGKGAVVVDERIVRAADFSPLSYFSVAPGSDLPAPAQGPLRTAS